MSDYSKANERKYVYLGWILIIVVVFLAGGWAAFAPLDQGVAVPGVMIITGQKKSIQHPTGGAVQKIFVYEGQSVKAGDLLVKLDDVQIRSKVESLSNRYFDALLDEQRLVAENAQNEKLVLRKESKWKTPNDWTDRVNLQHSLFQNRRNTLLTTESGLEATVMGLEAQLKGLLAAEKNQKRQIEIISNQLEGSRSLSESGYIPRNQTLDQESQLAGVRAQLAETIGRSNQIVQTIKQTNWNIRQKQEEFRNETSNSLLQVRAKLLSLDSELDSSAHELERTRIVAPVSGRIAGLKVFTIGGVIAPAETMMYIIPSDTKLEVQGKLPVNYIDRVEPGQSVELLFTAFNHTPRVSGTLTMVGADRLKDDQTQPYFDVRAVADTNSLTESLNSNVRPGMPVEIFIRTGERSLLNYLLKPIIDRAHVALTER